MRTNSLASTSFSSTFPRIARVSRKGFAVVTMACAAFALPAFAQSTATTTPAEAIATSQPHRGQHTSEHAANHQQWQQNRLERRQQHLTQLRQKLALTPAQDKAWSDFEQAMQPQANSAARLDRQAMQKLSTPERIDQMRAQRTQRAAAMDARGDATKAFYAQLQPAQQQTFDQEHKRGMQQRNRMGKRHGGEKGLHRPHNAG